MELAGEEFNWKEGLNDGINCGNRPKNEKCKKNLRRKIKHCEVKVRQKGKSVTSFWLGQMTKRKRSGRGTCLLEHVEFPVPMRHLGGFFFSCKQFHLLVHTYIPLLVSSWCHIPVQNYLVITFHTGVDVSLLKEEFSISLLRLIKPRKLNKFLENKANIPHSLSNHSIDTWLNG